MKICILGDTHFGMRNSSIKFLDYSEKFYKENFFPYLIKNNIKTIIQLGDFFDVRTHINFLTLQRTKEMFLDKLDDYGIKMIVLAGNHDVVYKTSNKLNSLRLLLREYNNIQVLDSPGTIYISDDSDKFKYPICIIPWICQDNQEQCLGELKKTNAKICMGHFEISGFSMYRGMTSEEGINRGLFKHFDMVFSGHYHHRSHSDNIFYVGTPMEITWQDYDDPRGFHVFDLSNSNLEFIKNPHVMFHRIKYDDTEETNISLEEDISKYKDTYVKVVVVNKSDPFKFDSFIDKLNSIGPIDINIVEDFTELEEAIEKDDIDQAEDTMTIIDRFVDDIDQDTIDNNRLKSVLRELYVEAINKE